MKLFSPLLFLLGKGRLFLLFDGFSSFKLPSGKYSSSFSLDLGGILRPFKAREQVPVWVSVSARNGWIKRTIGLRTGEVKHTPANTENRQLEVERSEYSNGLADNHEQATSSS
jgi:hypothetical protein